MLNTLQFPIRYFFITAYLLINAACAQATEQAVQLLDLNAATAQQLADSLPGIGPAKAARIVQWRDENGPFPNVQQLLDVHGIGPKTLERLLPLLRVGDAASAKRAAKEAQQHEDQVRLSIQQIVDQANRDAARELVRKSP